MRADAKSHGLLTFRRSEAKSNFTRLNELYVFIFFFPPFSFLFPFSSSFPFFTLHSSLIANILNIHEACHHRRGIKLEDWPSMKDLPSPFQRFCLWKGKTWGGEVEAPLCCEERRINMKRASFRWKIDRDYRTRASSIRERERGGRAAAFVSGLALTSWRKCN